MRKGTAPHLEVLYAHYLFGKPRDRVKIETDVDTESGLSLVDLAKAMTDQELAVFLAVARRIKEGRTAPIKVGNGLNGKVATAIDGILGDAAGEAGAMA
jgi:hypothetical protein